MSFIDTNVNFGHWPFERLPKRTLAQLAQHLEFHNIEQALVSHIETLFIPDPDPCNRELIRSSSRFPSITPVPVINLTNPDWHQNLEAYRSMTDLKAVKLYPSFHNYSLGSVRCKEFTRFLVQTDIRLIIGIRMLDERHQYFGLKVKGLPIKQLISYAKRFPDLPIHCTGLYRLEILEIAEQCPNISTELSFADGHDLINRLTEKMSPDRLTFGSHTPLMVTEANTYKHQVAQISKATQSKIAHRNAKKLFKL